MESAGQKEELSHSTTGDQLWELTITNPKEKIFNRRFSSESPQQEKVYLTSPRRTQVYPSNPAKEKGHYLELSLFSNALSFKTILPNLLLFSIK